MPVKKELNAEQQKLYNELKKLSKKANQRIVRLERAFRQRYMGNKKIKGQASNRAVAGLDSYRACKSK